MTVGLRVAFTGHRSCPFWLAASPHIMEAPKVDRELGLIYAIRATDRAAVRPAVKAPAPL
jgi:hypothetical protein